MLLHPVNGNTTPKKHLTALARSGAKPTGHPDRYLLASKNPTTRPVSKPTTSLANGPNVVKRVTILVQKLIGNDYTKSEKAKEELEKLIRLNPQIIQILFKTLNGIDEIGAYDADKIAKFCSKFPNAVTSALPTLIGYLKGSNRLACYLAIKVLKEIGDRALPAKKSLINLLGHSHKLLVYHAMVILGSLGHKATDATPALFGVLNSPDNNLSVYAGYTLARIGNSSPALISKLAKVIKDQTFCYLPQLNDCVPNVALHALTWISGRELAKNNDLVAPLVKLLSHYSENFRHTSVLLLSRIAEGKAPNSYNASSIVAKLGINQKLFVHGLIRALDSDDTNVAYSAAIALGNFGNMAKIAIPTLKRQLERKEVRFPAACALAHLGYRSAKVEELVKKTILTCPGEECSKYAEDALKRYAKDALKKLMKNAPSSKPVHR